MLLPPSAGGVLANAALPLAGRVAVNLNYTLSTALLNRCIEQCGIRHVLTSRRVLERLKLGEIKAELVYLEDVAAKLLGSTSWRRRGKPAGCRCRAWSECWGSIASGRMIC